MELTAERAWQLALMLASGVPANEAIVYFLGADSDLRERQLVLQQWFKSSKLQAAIRRLNGADWHEMPLQERLQKAIDKHYSELAYFLYSHNYSEVDGINKTKSDTARTVLEAKLAGLAGQRDPLMAWIEDLKAKKAAEERAKSTPVAVPAPVN